MFVPLKTFKALGIDEANTIESLATMRAYDNTKRAILGSIELEILIGPIEFLINFQIIDNLANFNLLLGRTWIHQVGALPSSLYQKIKIPVGNDVIVVRVDSERIIMPKDTPVLGLGSQDIRL